MNASIEDTLDAAERYARNKFAGRWDADEKVADAMSVAWEFAMKYGERAWPERLAALAVRRVSQNRQFRIDTRTVDAPNRAPRTRDLDFDLNDLFSIDDNPADVAAFRIDFADWFASLSETKRSICETLASGESTADAALRCGVSRGRISQIRRELEDSYRDFLSE